MKKINFTTTINAPKEKVWKTLWDLESYKSWTSVFAEGSTVKTDDWKQGSRIEFVDGSGDGMVSEVLANETNRHMSFRHLGQIKNGIDDLSSDAVKQWSGATENYTLTEKDGKTELLVEMDTSGAEFEAFLINTWPTALGKIKGLAEGSEKKAVTVETIVNAPVEKAWTCFSNPEHITKWAFASEEWHAPRAENDLRTGGKFLTRMEAKDGSVGFDFGGDYTNVKPHELIEYVMGDGRTVSVSFKKLDENRTQVTETFDLENTHSEEMQRGGWQAILDNYKNYTESAQ